MPRPCPPQIGGLQQVFGARLTTFLPDGRVAYDGRATAAENWFERTGFANPDMTITDDEVLDFRHPEALGDRVFTATRKDHALSSE